jgi:hypothetical protein
MKVMTAVGSLALLAGIGWAQPPTLHAREPLQPDALEAEIEALRAAKVAWRGIPWKTCLLDGLKESHARNKPALLWVFIDRPTDDARC